jgi:hypothetical protein
MRVQVIASLLFASVAYAGMTINTPAIKQCEDAVFSITGATGKVTLTVLPSDQPCDHDDLFVGSDFGNGDTNTLKKITIAAGTSVVVVADDEAGNEIWTNTIVVGGSAAACSSTGTTPATGARTGAAATTPTTRATAPVNAAGASSSDAPTSGAASIKASFGLGAFAALAALVFTA